LITDEFSSFQIAATLPDNALSPATAFPWPPRSACKASFHQKISLNDSRQSIRGPASVRTVDTAISGIMAGQKIVPYHYYH
jgi:hypothetical protein